MAGLYINEFITIPESELRLSFARAGGPGGQNVNKVETKVELRWTLAASRALNAADAAWLQKKLASRLTSDRDLLVTSTRYRDQSRNRDDAQEKLVSLIRKALVRPVRCRRTRPSPKAVERRLESKRQRSGKKAERARPSIDG